MEMGKPIEDFKIVSMLKIIAFILILTLILNSNSNAQFKRDTSITIPMFSFSYSIQNPGGDLAKRFGISSSIGSAFTIKTKSNYVFGVDFDFIFGNHLKETSMFDSVRTENGNFLNVYGEYAKVALSERGFFIGGKIGKIFPVLKNNKNSGILFTIRPGLLQHKIRIENDGNNTPYILDDYKKGYDRLTNGFAVSEFIGFVYFNKNQLYNFNIGVEFYQAWTQNRRSINFDTMLPDTQQRIDLLSTIKVSWIIPIYRRQPLEFYYD